MNKGNINNNNNNNRHDHYNHHYPINNSNINNQFQYMIPLNDHNQSSSSSLQSSLSPLPLLRINSLKKGTLEENIGCYHYVSILHFLNVSFPLNESLDLYHYIIHPELHPKKKQIYSIQVISFRDCIPCLHSLKMLLSQTFLLDPHTQEFFLYIVSVQLTFSPLGMSLHLYLHSFLSLFLFLSKSHYLQPANKIQQR